MRPITENTLFYGDNLPILREYVPDESADLIYLDPPFNSNRDYNVLFKDESGDDSEAQIVAFTDTWHWGPTAEQEYDELVTEGIPAISDMISALRGFIGSNQMMAYLVMMTARLVELHRVLKPTGSLYLHCDPTASHYLKIILDTIFGVKRFRNEIIWKRTSSHNGANKWGSIHDTILFYTKSSQWTWNPFYLPYDQEYIDTFFDEEDEDGIPYKRTDLTGNGSSQGESGTIWRDINVTAKGRHWAIPDAIVESLGGKGAAKRLSTIDKLELLDTNGRIHWPKKKGGMPRLKQYTTDLPGIPPQDIIQDIRALHNNSQERLGYPTQKPLSLLERILFVSTNPGDVVLDPFCGCGTSIAAAHKADRRWIGIDISHLSIALQKYRLQMMYHGINFAIIGEPKDFGAARQLAKDDPYQFQWWALSLIHARPVGGETGSKQGKKGKDQGIDGIISFRDGQSTKPKKVIIQVKSGKVSSRDIRDLAGVIDREKAPIGVFITLVNPTAEMKLEATKAGWYESVTWGRKYPRMQILTIQELFAGKEVQMPPTYGTFKQAQRIEPNTADHQERFDI